MQQVLGERGRWRDVVQWIGRRPVAHWQFIRVPKRDARELTVVDRHQAVRQAVPAGTQELAAVSRQHEIGVRPLVAERHRQQRYRIAVG